MRAEITRKAASRRVLCHPAVSRVDHVQKAMRDAEIERGWVKGMGRRHSYGCKGVIHKLKGAKARTLPLQPTAKSSFYPPAPEILRCRSSCASDHVRQGQKRARVPEGNALFHVRTRRWRRARAPTQTHDTIVPVCTHASRTPAPVQSAQVDAIARTNVFTSTRCGCRGCGWRVAAEGLVRLMHALLRDRAHYHAVRSESESGFGWHRKRAAAGRTTGKDSNTSRVPPLWVTETAVGSQSTTDRQLKSSPSFAA
jgi:hypothetical protein